jgi:hypothetical protein
MTSEDLGEDRSQGGLPRTQRTSAIPVWFAVTGAKADERQTLLGRGSDAMAEFEWLPWMRW